MIDFEPIVKRIIKAYVDRCNANLPSELRYAIEDLIRLYILEEDVK